jgi:4-amino-4-deoxy-L-arabinose transferase-like glycosyltransferase
MNLPILSLASRILFGLIVFVFFYGNGNWDIYILDEAKNAEAAREMIESGDWIIPRFNGELRYDKPPLHYYLFGLSYWLFDVNPFAARFFPAVMGCLLAFSVFFKIKSRLGENKAFWSTLLFISSLHVQLQFKLSVPDPFLIFFLALSIFSVESYIKSNSKSKKDLRLAFIFIALATLSKGPIALVLFTGTLIVYFLFVPHRYRISWTKMFDPLAIAIFLALTIPWYGSVTWVTEGVWIEEFIFHHNLNRFSEPMEGHGGPFYLTFLMVFIGFLPGSLFLFRVFKLKYKKIVRNPLLCLSCIFSLVTLVFFSMSSTKLPNYAAPVFPFLAVIFAYTLDAQETHSRIRFVAFGLTSLIPIASVGLVFGMLPAVPELDGLEKYAQFMIIPFFLALCSIMFLLFKKFYTSLFTLCVAFLVLNFLLIHFYLPGINNHNPIRLSEDIWTGKKLHFWGEFNPAFPFSSQQVIPEWEGQNGLQVLIITTDRAIENKPFPDPYQVLFRSKDLFEKTNTMIIRPTSVEE